MKLSTTNLYDLVDLLEFIEENLPIRYAGASLVWGDQARQKIVLARERSVEVGDLGLVTPRELIEITDISFRRAYFSPPLTWEPCRGGLLTALARSLNLEELTPFPPFVKKPRYKLAIYVPIRCINDLLNTLANTGAGLVGRYAGCSFLVQGLGRFNPLSGANPIMGEVGQWESVEEVLLLSQARMAELGWAVAAAVLVHPYEEVVIDVWELKGLEDTYGTSLVGRWTRQDTPQKGPALGERLVLSHSRDEVDEKHLLAKGIRWLVVPGEKTKISTVSGLNIWEISEDRFYYPGLRQWQDYIEQLCQLVKSPI